MKFALTFFWSLLFLSCGSTKSQDQASETVDFSVDKNKKIVCFIYHRFGDSRYPSTNIAVETFKAHLDYLKQNNFQVLTLSGGMEYLNSSEPAQKTAIITIDDGYQSFYDNGLPLLQEYGFPATLFINTETVGGSSYMDWQSIEDSKTKGIEIGNHTHSHAFFLDLPESERYDVFRKEIETSQELIEENLGITPKSFAYPYGEFDNKMKEVVKEAGFDWAAAQNSGVIHYRSDPYQLPRFPMAEAFGDPDKFISKVNMSPLKITVKDPDSFMMPSGNNSPQLSITFQKEELNVDQLQCFIQGSDCKTELNVDGELVELTITPSNSIRNRRRTLYTITVPDKNGNWYWFSHLWINPAVGE